MRAHFTKNILFEFRKVLDKKTYKSFSVVETGTLYILSQCTTENVYFFCLRLLEFSDFFRSSLVGRLQRLYAGEQTITGTCGGEQKLDITCSRLATVRLRDSTAPFSVLHAVVPEDD